MSRKKAIFATIMGISDIMEGVQGTAEWGDSLANCILISLTAVLFILYMSRLLALLPFLGGGLTRWNDLANIEDSMGRTRDRNALAAISVLAIGLLASRYCLYYPRFIRGMEPGVRSLVTIGVITAVLLLRAALVHACVPRRGGRDNYLLSQRTLYDFVIIWALGGGATAGTLYIFRANILTVRVVMLVCAGLLWLIFLVRRTQILRNSCSQFTAILYLCTLELIPAALIVVSALVF